MDEILAQSTLDDDFLQLALKDRNVDLKKMPPKRAARFVRYTAMALRGNIAREIVGLAHREFCTYLAESSVLQWFLHISEVERIRVYSKSTSERFAKWVSPESLRIINDKLIAQASEKPNTLASTLKPGVVAAFNLEQALDTAEAYLDTSCLKVNCHYPVDWLLLRDASRTLLKGTLCIRAAGLIVRMPQSPKDFLRDMNVLCIAMHAKGRKAEGKKHQKAILRDMKKLAKRVGKHASSHLEELQARRAESTLSEGQANQIAQRITNVIDQLPAIIKQAHERIIGGRAVAVDDKILSIYDDQVDLIVRGKAGAAVEFGNKYTLVESAQGVILYCKLHSDKPADAKVVVPAVDYMLDVMKLPLTGITGDRGTQSKANDAYLTERGVTSGLCPRKPEALAEKLKEPGQAERMKRRAGTEARIAIFGNFMEREQLGRSFAAREQGCGWAVLAHNLWVIARMPQAVVVKKKQENAPVQEVSNSRKARAA
jgi:hypothetical protein